MVIHPTHTMWFYDTPESREDFETAIKAKDMRHFIDDLRNEIRSKIKYQEKEHWEEFRDCVNDLLKEYDLTSLF